MQKSLKHFWDSPYSLWAIVAAVILGLSVILFQTNNPIALDEGLRHIVMGQEYLENGIENIQGWGDYFFTGYFTEHNSNPWFLAELSYIPFTIFADLVVGLKIYTIALALFLMACFYPILRFYKTSHLLTALFLLGLMFGSVTFLSRLVIARPMVFSIGAFLLAYNATLRKQYLQLIPIIAVAVLFSHLFIFALFVSLSTGIWLWYIGKKDESIRCTLYGMIGLAIGLVLHPQTLQYVHYIINIFADMLFGSSDLIVGGELLSGILNPDIALWLIIISLISSLCSKHRKAFIRELITMRREIILTGIYAIIFLICYIKMMRSVEYLFPVILILILQIVTLTTQRQKATEDYLREPIFKGGRITVLHTLFALFLLTFTTVALNERQGSKYNVLADYNAIEQVPAGSKVLNIRWSPFPILFHLNHDVQYARGMDPRFDHSTALFDATLDRWVTKKKIQELGFAGAKKEFRERISKVGFYLIQEARDLNVEQWLDDVRNTYTSDYLLLSRNANANLIETLKTIEDVSLFAESRAIAIFSFND